MATASNSPPCLELGPSLSKLVDKTGSRGKILNYFADRADIVQSAKAKVPTKFPKSGEVTKYLQLTSVLN